MGLLGRPHTFWPMRRSILYFASWRLVIASSLLNELLGLRIAPSSVPAGPEPTGPKCRSAGRDRGSRNAAGPERPARRGVSRRIGGASQIAESAAISGGDEVAEEGAHGPCQPVTLRRELRRGAAHIIGDPAGPSRCFGDGGNRLQRVVGVARGHLRVVGDLAGCRRLLLHHVGDGSRDLVHARD